MKFEIVQDLRATPDAVDAALVDPAFLVRMDELPKLGSAAVVSQARDGDVVRQDVRYLFQAELSSAVTRVVDPKKLTWVERSVCDLAAHRTQCEIRPDNYGGMLSGRYDAVIVATDAGSRAHAHRRDQGQDAARRRQGRAGDRGRARGERRRADGAARAVPRRLIVSRVPGPGVGGNRGERNRRRRSEFVTTNTDEHPIAAAAITGFSSPNAANGIAATL